MAAQGGKRTERPIENEAVARVFAAYPAAIRRKLMALRQLIFDTAAETAGVGALEETLKWGRPAYLTSQSRSGTTIRIDWLPATPDRYAMYVHCQTNMIETLRAQFASELTFEGNRGVVLRDDEALPTDALRACIEAALTYHMRKNARRKRS